MATTSGPTVTAPRGRIAGLDLIRGGAVALVLARHAWPQQVGAAGSVGVVAFFALSGYLITGILRNDIETRGSVRVRRFYRNRVLRLYPPLLLLLLVFAVVTLTLNPFGERSTIVPALAIAALYLADLPVPGGSTGLSHLWTLATEEQFYLIWPWLLLFGLKRQRLRAIVAAAAVAIVAVLLISLYFSKGHADRLYQLPTSWCIAMVIGASAQLWGTPLSRLRRSTGAAVAGAALVVLLGLSALPEDKQSPLLYLLVGPAAAVCTVAIIEHVKHWRELPTRWLAPLLSLGTVSYAAYLWNYPIALLVRALPWGGLLSIVLTIGAAWASWVIVERPVQKWRSRLDGRRGERPGSLPAVTSEASERPRSERSSP